MLTALFVVARIVANPVSNVFQKQLTQRSANPLFIIGATDALLALAVLPLFFLGAVPLALAPGFWTNMVICASLAVASNVLLVYALQSADLSVLGPINAYKSVLSLVLGVFLLVARGIQFRFAALAVSATEAIFLKKALLLSSPLTTFVFWSILGVPIAAAAMALLHRKRLGTEMALFRLHWPTYAWLAVTTGIMQLTSLLTFEKLQVGYSLALFQLSTLISVFLGYRYFQEGQIRKRLLGSAIMAAGAVLIVLQGHRR